MCGGKQEINGGRLNCALEILSNGNLFHRGGHKPLGYLHKRRRRSAVAYKIVIVSYQKLLLIYYVTKFLLIPLHCD